MNIDTNAPHWEAADIQQSFLWSLGEKRELDGFQRFSNIPIHTHFSLYCHVLWLLWLSNWQKFSFCGNLTSLLKSVSLRERPTLTRKKWWENKLRWRCILRLSLKVKQTDHQPFYRPTLLHIDIVPHFTLGAAQYSPPHSVSWQTVYEEVCDPLGTIHFISTLIYHSKYLTFSVLFFHVQLEIN